MLPVSARHQWPVRKCHNGAGFVILYRRSIALFAVIWAVLFETVSAQSVLASELPSVQIVQKQRFELPSYATTSGHVLEDVQIGWEAYGELNENKDNAILITHHFSGSSHAAGRYTKDGPLGYWDSIIGPGKAIDTNRFYVISSDTLVNLNAFDPNVITTGPATIDPRTGKAYGLDFPVVTIRDFVNVQAALVESLGITKLHAVAGPSMGGLQALEWALAYPERVERVLSVIAGGAMDAWTVSFLERWAMPIRLDKHWNQGNYTQQPREGLVAALSFITQDALSPAFFNGIGDGLNFSPQEVGPSQDIQATHSINQWLHERALARSRHVDANHLLYLVRACQLYVAGHQGSLERSFEKLKANVLLLPAKTDLLLYPELAEQVVGLGLAHNKSIQLETLDGPNGHIEGLLSIAEKSQTIRQFLNQ